MLDKKGFDLWAKEYDNEVNSCYQNKEYPFDGYYDVLDSVLSRIKPGSKVLDIGFGTGVLTKKAYDANCEIHGIDFSSEMVSIAKSKMPRGRFYECDFNNNLPDAILGEKFDYIISTYAIHHLTDHKKVKFISLLKKLLNNKGKIIIGDIAFSTKQELAQCAKNTKGFDKDEIYIVAETFLPQLKESKITAKFYKMSHYAGIIIIEK